MPRLVVNLYLTKHPSQHNLNKLKTPPINSPYKLNTQTKEDCFKHYKDNCCKQLSPYKNNYKTTIKKIIILPDQTSFSLSSPSSFSYCSSEPLPEEKIRASDGIVRLQSGTNKFDSQKGMVSFGTNRRETTRMKDTKHPEYDHERNIDQSEIPLQSGTNKFASQKGMVSFGTNRRETTKMLDTAHPEYSHESSIDQTSIPYQMGSNRYASQKGMTCFGQPRWEVLDPSISYQNRKSQGMVRLQSGTNRFASQAGMTGFGTPRNTTYEAEAGELPYEDMKKSETIIPSQAGWNKGDSQKLMTGFGTPRDVKGKHLKRIWELEYPEEAEISLDRL